MISTKTTEETFAKLFQRTENKTCFECGSPSTQWASVNNGIFLCLNCSGVHRGFGVQISFVRSVTMDSWSDKQLQLMTNGGNAKLKSFFEQYNIPKDAPMDFKYKTKAAIYYREMLKAIVDGTDLPTAPSQDEALELVETQKANITPGSMGSVGSQPADQTQRKSQVDSILGFVGTAWATAQATTKDVAGKVADKYEKTDFKKEFKETGEKVAVATKATATVVAEKSKEYGKDAAVVAEKGFSALKKGFFSTVDYVKKKAEEVKSNSSGSASKNVGYEEYVVTNDANKPPAGSPPPPNN